MAPSKLPSKLLRSLRPRDYLVRECKDKLIAKHSAPTSYVMVPENQLIAMSQALVRSAKALKEERSKALAFRESMRSLKDQLEDAIDESTNYASIIEHFDDMCDM